MNQVQWYAKLPSGTSEPLTSGQLFQLAQLGDVTPETPVRRGASGEWVTAEHVKGLFTEPAAKSNASVASKDEDAFLGEILEEVSTEEPNLLKDGPATESVTAPAPSSNRTPQKKRKPTASGVTPEQEREYWHNFWSIVGGAILATSSMWVSLLMFTPLLENPALRFQGDNAIGATANASELSLFLTACIVCAIAGATLVLVVELRKLRFAITDGKQGN